MILPAALSMRDLLLTDASASIGTLPSKVRRNCNVLIYSTLWLARCWSITNSVIWNIYRPIGLITENSQ